MKKIKWSIVSICQNNYEIIQISLPQLKKEHVIVKKLFLKI